MILDDPWFVANDLCAVLDLRNPRQVLDRLEDDEKGVHLTDTLGGQQSLNVVSESGMYALIFGSRKPEAKRFRRWVTGTVLPTLRKTGKFELMPSSMADQEPEDFDPTRLQAAIGVVREARRLFGNAPARAIWTQLGLPAPIAGSRPDFDADPLCEPLSRWLMDKSAVTILDACQALGLGQATDVPMRRRVGALLRLLGWSSRKARYQGAVVNLYQRMGV
jgi:hypothetical protein